VSNIRDYRDLLVWQKAMALSEDVYAHSAKFPPSEQYGLTAQVRRAAISVPANIAEGHQRYSTAEYIRFLSIARASAAELETHILLARRLDLTCESSACQLFEQSQELRRMLNALIAKLRYSQKPVHSPSPKP
jgi:four helix bundle protein